MPVFYTSRTSKPSSPSRSSLIIDELRGIDLSSAETAVDASRSPDCINMTRAASGKVRKRYGYEKIAEFDGAINGAYRFKEQVVYHAGTQLLLSDGTVLYDNMADARSSGAVIGSMLVILDGKSLVAVRRKEDDSGIEALTLSDIAAVPRILIAKTPTGGGTSLDAVNLLSDKWREDFFGEAGVTEYQLAFNELDDTPVTVEVMQSDGVTWKTLTQDTDFTVNREDGIVTFKTAPGVTSVDGQDNIRITASKDRSEGRSKIAKCTICTLFGRNGSQDRLFVSGNPDYPNYDWWSELNDATYFADISYGILGQSDSAIVGYSVLGNSLAAHKDENEGSIYVRQGELGDDNEMEFVIINIVRGVGAIAPKAFGYLTNEPIFLTPVGIYAITTSELTSEKYEQVRSFYINRALLQEDNLSQATACIYRDMYCLAVNGKVYVLDGSTKSYARDEPHSSYQYEAFLWDNIPAHTIWSFGSRLYFGTAEGEVFRFFTEADGLAAYNDNGAPIVARWQTPDIEGARFYRNKYFRRLAVQLTPSAATGVVCSARFSGAWFELINAVGRFRFFDFAGVDFDKFTFLTDATARTVLSKIKIRKVDHAAFRLENSELNEPFGIESIALEFSENGYYKGG